MGHKHILQQLQGSSINGPVSLSVRHATCFLYSAKMESRKMGVKMNIAVVDKGANLIAFERMDGAWLGSVDIAIKKARTAVFFNMPTGNIGGLSQPGGALYNIEHSNDGLITFPGGLPIKDKNDNLIGGIGVSGSTVEDDHQAASAGVKG